MQHLLHVGSRWSKPQSPAVSANQIAWINQNPIFKFNYSSSEEIKRHFLLLNSCGAI